MQYLGHLYIYIYTRKFVIYLKLRFTWMSYILLALPGAPRRASLVPPLQHGVGGLLSWSPRVPLQPESEVVLQQILVRPEEKGN